MNLAIKIVANLLATLAIAMLLLAFSYIHPRMVAVALAPFFNSSIWIYFRNYMNVDEAIDDMAYIFYCYIIACFILSVCIVFCGNSAIRWIKWSRSTPDHRIWDRTAATRIAGRFGINTLMLAATLALTWFFITLLTTSAAVDAVFDYFTSTIAWDEFVSIFDIQGADTQEAILTIGYELLSLLVSIAIVYAARRFITARRRKAKPPLNRPA